MKPTLPSEIREVTEAVHYRPAISIIMPFESKMGSKLELIQQLKLAADTVSREVRKNYQDNVAELVMGKLKRIIQDLDITTFKKSIAIYVSPVFEKVLHLDIPVEERIIVDESFEIRDLVYAKKEAHKYLLLILSGKESKIFLGDSASFVKVKSHVPDNIAAFENDVPEATANFSDPSYRKEVLLKKFLHQTDQGLSALQQPDNLPVFVMGTQKVLGYFKALTKHEKNIAGYIPGNYEGSPESVLREALKPYLADWKKIKLRDLRQQIEKAADAGKLAAGLKEVWKLAAQKRGRLLIVDRTFKSPAQHGSNEEIITGANEPYNKFSYIKDAVDDVIEKVLQHGGDVEFVEEGMLDDYDQIALLQYY